MDPGFQLKYDNPRKNAGLLSQLFFSWMIPTIRKGKQMELDMLHLHKPMECDESNKLGDKLESNWKKELCEAKLQWRSPNLLKVLCKTFGPYYMKWGITMLLLFLNRSLQILILARFIQLFTLPDDGSLKTEMYLCGTVLVLIGLISVFLDHHGIFHFNLTGMRCKIALSSLVFRKITRMNQVSLSNIATGQVINLLSNDMSRFDTVVEHLHILWIAPILLPVLLYFMWQEVGVSSFIGVFTMAIISLPLQVYLAKIFGAQRLKIAEKTDNRISIMNEIISGIQIIKIYSWEKPFERIVKKVRSAEISDIATSSYCRSVFMSSCLFLERTSLFSTVVCFICLGNQITSDKVFSMTQYFSIIILMFAIFYPQAISYGAECIVSIQRLKEFLMMEEKEITSIGQLSEGNVQINKIYANWIPTTPTLENISVMIPVGSLCVVVGPVGSGKSSLLQLLLGELPACSGEISVGGVISFASQVPWLFSASVRNNILFGQDFDEKWYEQVVKVCALDKDFVQFPQGDRTLVGDRGVSLSGGQKARINLARTIYRKADIYLMDDPLSAVDTRVAKFIFEECIYAHLNGKTRILVTHQLQFLKKADLIIIMDKGRIEAMGSFEDIMNTSVDINEILASAAGTKEQTEVINDNFRQGRRRSHSQGNVSMNEHCKISQEDHCIFENGVQVCNTSSLLVLWKYWRATDSVCLITILFIVFMNAQLLTTLSDFWLALWTAQEEMRFTNIPAGDRIQPTWNSTTKHSSKFFDEYFDEISIDGTIDHLIKTSVSLYVLGAIIVIAVIFTLIRSFLFYKASLMSSKNLHKRMLHCLLQAPMKFFNTNPCGRILNRFSKDIGSVDEVLPRVLIDTLQIILVIVGILINVGLSNMYIIAICLFCGIIFWKIQQWFVASSKSIKHLEAMTRSPIFSYVNSTLNGIPTIRGFQAENTLISEFQNHQNTHSSAMFLSISCKRSFGLWLDIICVIFLGFVVYSFIILRHFTTVYASLVGLALSQSMALTGMLQHGVRQIAEVVNELTSVERILQYINLESERPFETPKENLLKSSWPEEGRIEFRNLYLRYIETHPPVLKNLSFTIKPGEKIGIVGRTGAGKSSLISALFRLAFIDGSIFIDGIDTKSVGLADLRKKISVIPQEGFLFSATLRYNLDPLNEFSDEQIWTALEAVNLKTDVPSLNYLICESGSKFSLGQIQLISLARVILRKNNILILDEATANMDLRTDAFIQNTIREKFFNCTVLTIAHRLNSVMDSDRVLVMNLGELIEFDEPHILLQYDVSLFRKMVDESGPSLSKQLRSTARKAYYRRKAYYMSYSV